MSSIKTTTLARLRAAKAARRKAIDRHYLATGVSSGRVAFSAVVRDDKIVITTQKLIHEP